jgi:hypothetical protein
MKLFNYWFRFHLDVRFGSLLGFTFHPTIQIHPKVSPKTTNQTIVCATGHQVLSWEWTRANADRLRRKMTDVLKRFFPAVLQICDGTYLIWSYHLLQQHHLEILEQAWWRKLNWSAAQSAQSVVLPQQVTALSFPLQMSWKFERRSDLVRKHERCVARWLKFETRLYPVWRLVTAYLEINLF